MMKQTKQQRNMISSLLLFTFLILAGCQSAPKRDPAFAAVRPPLPPVQPEANGAIYQPGFDTRLFEDVKARRVGDILTVNLVENTTASKAASTDIEKDTTTTVTNPTVFGASPEFDLPKFFPLSNTRDVSLETSLSSSHEFEGSGESSQNNNLSGSVSVSVVEVLPNGNLVVRGEKRMTLNQGNEYVRISGIVRSTDILSDNSVLSTQIADATIMYTGEGSVNDSNVIGWLARFFVSAIMPF